MKAMIFAAGLGTRLRPITDTLPKALIEVGGKPMLRHVIDRIISAGITDFVVNIHHHASLLRSYLNSLSLPGVNISISDESDLLLDTGGAIVKAAPMLEGSDILIHNADILTDFDLSSMMDMHSASGADATLMTAHRDSSRQLLFSPSGRMVGWRNMTTGETRSPYAASAMPPASPLAFGGVHIISPQVINMLKTYRDTIEPFSITPFYIDTCAKIDIRSFTPKGTYHWFDIGRPETLRLAREKFSK